MLPQAEELAHAKPKNLPPRHGKHRSFKHAWWSRKS